MATEGHPKHLWLEIAAASIRDRLHGLKRTGRVAFATLALLTAALGFMTWSLGGTSRSPVASASALQFIHLLPRPVHLPTAHETSATSCPNPPELSSPLLPGAYVSAPSLVAPGTSSLVVAGRTYDLTGTCEYTEMLPASGGGTG
jgi:hypothetical protein